MNAFFQFQRQPLPWFAKAVTISVCIWTLGTGNLSWARELEEDLSQPRVPLLKLELRDEVYVMADVGLTGLVYSVNPDHIFVRFIDRSGNANFKPFRRDELLKRIPSQYVGARADLNGLKGTIQKVFEGDIAQFRHGESTFPYYVRISELKILSALSNVAILLGCERSLLPLNLLRDSGK